jgi:hypothetical protein
MRPNCAIAADSTRTTRKLAPDEKCQGMRQTAACVDRIPVQTKPVEVEPGIVMKQHSVVKMLLSTRVPLYEQKHWQ